MNPLHSWHLGCRDVFIRNQDVCVFLTVARLHQHQKSSVEKHWNGQNTKHNVQLIAVSSDALSLHSLSQDLRQHWWRNPPNSCAVAPSHVCVYTHVWRNVCVIKEVHDYLRSDQMMHVKHILSVFPKLISLFSSFTFPSITDHLCD